MKHFAWMVIPILLAGGVAMGQRYSDWQYDFYWEEGIGAWWWYIFIAIAMGIGFLWRTWRDRAKITSKPNPSKTPTVKPKHLKRR